MISELCALRSVKKGMNRVQEGALPVYAVANVSSPEQPGGVYRMRIHRTGPSRLALV